MRTANIAAALFVLTAWSLSATAQPDKCPSGYSNDDCTMWYFERADRDLIALVASKIDERSKMTTSADLIEGIKETGREAHRAWMAYREAECKAYVAASVMSARADKGRMASCLLSIRSGVLRS